MMIPSQYQNFQTFELLVSPKTTAGYPVQIVDSPTGSTTAISQFDSLSPNIQDMLQQLKQANTTRTLLENLGEYLFQSLFVGQIASLFRSSLGYVRGNQQGLRIRLRIEPPELAVLPWEYLYDSEEESFLAISSMTPLTRYPFIPNAVYLTAVEPPLRVLLVISNPSDVIQLNVEREKELIQQALDQSIRQGLIRYELVELATIDRVSQAIRSFHPHIFHFAGHGMYQGDKAYIVLEDEHKHAKLIDEKVFREFFHGLFNIRVAVLNACESASGSSLHPLIGLAPRLLQRNLAAVVAMQQPISDQAALIFSRDFYRSLAAGYAIDVAVAEARRAIFQEHGDNIRDWGIPVVFLRAKDGQLFQIKEEIQIELYIFNQALSMQHVMYVRPHLLGRQLYAQVRASLKLPSDVSELNGRIGLRFEYILRYNGQILSEHLSLEELGIRNGANIDLEIAVTQFGPIPTSLPVHYRDPDHSNELSSELKRRLLVKAIGHLPAHSWAE